MKRFTHLILLLAVLASFAMPLAAQDPNRQQGAFDTADVHVGRSRMPQVNDISGAHIYHVVQRHWPEGCEAERAAFVEYSDTHAGELPAWLTPESKCGWVGQEYWGENLVTSVGQDTISKQISDTAAQPAAFNYVALTNTAITPALSDTTLSGEIGSNGLSRAQGTFTNTSAALGTPPTPGSLAIVGTTGAATLDYWVFSCTYQGCTAIGSPAQTTTANATLSNVNYVTGSFTGQLGAAYYVILRRNSSTTPSGAQTGGTAQTNIGIICTGQAGTNCSAGVGYISCGSLTAGTAPTCKFADMSNNTEAFTVPGSDGTYVGKHTVTKTFTATGTQSAQAFGIFNASSSGTLGFEGTFTSASLVNNDTLSFTETIYH
jgi:hypothetical protein